MAEAQDKSCAIGGPTAGYCCIEIERRTRWDPEVVGPEKVVVGGDD